MRAVRLILPVWPSAWPPRSWSPRAARRGRAGWLAAATVIAALSGGAATRNRPARVLHSE